MYAILQYKKTDVVEPEQNRTRAMRVLSHLYFRSSAPRFSCRRPSLVPSTALGLATALVAIIRVFNVCCAITLVTLQLHASDT